MRKKKLLSGTVATVCAAAVLVTGTLTWFAAASAKNEFSGKKTTITDTIVHDDYENSGKVGTTNKDVYIENTGNTEVYARIQLSELMDLTTSNEGTTDNPATKETSKLHKPTADLKDCTEGNSKNELFHDYFTWDLGTGTTNYVPTFAAEDGDAALDVKNSVKNPETGATVSTPETSIISMAEYKVKTDAQKKAFAGWIYDADGWAYWSQPLAPGMDADGKATTDVNRATGLLLNNVTSSNALADKNWYYAIDVKAEVVDINDIDKFKPGTGGDNEDLINQWKPSAKAPTIEFGANTPDSVAQGSTVNGPSVTTNPADATVTWSSSDAGKATVDPNTGKVTGVAPGTATITATVEGKDGTTSTKSYDITVTGPATKPVENMTIASNSYEIEKDATKDLSADLTVNPTDADKNLTWASSDPKVATVDPASGKVTAVGPGTATITVTDQATGKKAETTITVPEPKKNVEDSIKDEVKNNDFTYHVSDPDNNYDYAEVVKICAQPGGSVPTVDDYIVFYCWGPMEEVLASLYGVQLGTHEESYGYIPFSRITDDENVTFTSKNTDAIEIDTANKQLIVKYLPEYKEIIGGDYLNDNYHPKFDVTATLDGTSQDISIALTYEGALPLE